MEQAHRIRAAADARDQRVRQPALGGEHLLAVSRPMIGLEVAHHHRIGVRTRDVPMQ